MTTVRTYLVLPIVAAASTTSTGTTPATTPWPAQAWHQVFDRSPDFLRRPCSVADFWRQTSDGEIDLRFVYHDAVQRDPLDPSWVALVRGADAGTLLRTIVTSSVDLARLQGVDGVIVVASQSAPDSAVCTSFTVALTPSGGDPESAPVETRVSAVYLGWRDSHSVFCHELGHALGFPHPHGIVNPSGSTEYGSPPCVMGTASRWREVAAPLVPPSPSYVIPTTAAYWRHAGPDLSRASLLRWRLRAGLASGALVGGTGRVTIGDRASGAPRTVAWYHEADREYLVAELRRPLPGSGVDWDAALELDVLSDRDVYDAPGVVVHRLAWTGTGDWQVAYLGTIPVPLGLVADMKVTYGRTLSVSAVDLDAGTVSVHLSSATSVDRRRPQVQLSADVEYLPPPTPALLRRRLTHVRVPYEMGLTGPSCTVNTFWGRRIDRVARIIARALSTGCDIFGDRDQLQVTWSVAGVAAPQPSRLGDAPVRWEAPYEVRIDRAEGDAVVTERRTITLTARATWDTLEILTPPGDGLFRVPFGATVGAVPGTVTVLPEPVGATGTVEVTTAYTRFGDDYDEARAACVDFLNGKIAEAQRLHPSLLEGAVIRSVVEKPVPRFTTDEARRLVEGIRPT